MAATGVVVVDRGYVEATRGAMTTRIDPLAGKPAPLSSLVDVSKLVTAYYAGVPDPSVPAR